MIPENEIIEGCNVSYNGVMFSVKWKQASSVIIRPVNNIGFSQVNYEMLEGIPINAVILEKIGFSKITENLFSFTNKQSKTYQVEFGNDISTVIISGHKETVANLKLHQLQQLIYNTSKECISIKDSEVE